MIKFQLIQFNKILKKLKGISEFLAIKSFLVFIIMFIIVCFLGLLIFYHYVSLIETSSQTIEEEKLLSLDAKKQAKVLEEWQKRNENFHSADFREHFDPFHKVD